MNAKSVFALAVLSSAFTLAGCGDSPSAPAGHTAFIDVNTSSGTPQVQGYFIPNSSTPSSTPTVTISGTAGTVIAAGSVDSNGNVYTLVDTPGNNGPDTFTVNVYATAHGTPSAPSRTFTPQGITSVHGMSADGTGNVYILNSDSQNVYSLLKFSSTATGQATASVTNTNVSLSQINGGNIAIDTAGNLYMPYYDSVQQASSIAIFASGFNSNTIPTLLPAPSNGSYRSVTVDSNGKIYALGQVGTAATINVYTKNSDSYSITQTISGSNTVFQRYGSLAVDAAGDIFVRTPSVLPAVEGVHAQSAFSGDLILEFAAGANGNVAPVANFNTNVGRNSQTNDIVVY